MSEANASAPGSCPICDGQAVEARYIWVKWDLHRLWLSFCRPIRMRFRSGTIANSDPESIQSGRLGNLRVGSKTRPNSNLQNPSA